MSIFGLPLIMFQIAEVEDDMVSQICLANYDGTSITEKNTGQMCISVKDEDTIRQLNHSGSIANGSPQSIHLSDGSTSYQNNSGFDALVILVINNAISDLSINKFAIYDAPTDNSIAGATQRYSNEGGIVGIMDSASERLTIGPIRISSGNFCVIEAGLALNEVNVVNGLAWVVERAVA